MKFYRLLFICFSLLFAATSHAEIVDIGNDIKSLNLGSYLKYYEDTTNSLSYEEIKDKSFTPSLTTSLNWGYTRSTYWLGTKIRNSGNQQKTVFLNASNHYLEHFNLFLFSDTTLIEKYEFGALSKYKSRPIQISLKAGEEISFLCMAKSNTVLRIPVYLYSEEGLAEHRQSKNIIIGIFLGVFLFLMGLSVLISLALKGRIYTVFGLFIFFYTIYFLGSENLIPKVLIFGRYNFLMQCTVAIIPIIQFCYIYFSKLFFDFRGKVKWIRYSFTFMLTVTALLFVLFPFNYYLANRLLFYIPSIFGFALFGISLYVWLKLKRVFLRFYVLATFLFIAGVTLHNLTNSSAINNSFLAFNSIKFSYLLLLTIFAYALTDRFLLFSQNFTNILNEKVEERTTELEKTMFDLKRKQQQLIHSEKMATVGVLTAGLAHELNNPLNFINGGIELIKARNEEEQFIQDEEILSSFGFIEQGFERASTIVSSILEFSEGKKGTQTKQKLEDIIDRTIQVLPPKMEALFEIERNYKQNIEIVVESSGIHQVFLALFDNAVYYAKQSTNKPRIVVDIISKAAYYQITISNNGPVIPEDVLPRIFDPFYTTKEVGEGTGLGLSSVLSIVQEHGGSIEAINLKDGVSFVIKLPIS